MENDLWMKGALYGMKISLLPISFYRAVERNELSVMDWIRLAARIEHLDAFDIGIAMLKNRTPKYLQELRREIERSGKPLIMVTTYPDYTNPDPLQREREMLYSASDIAVASELGAAYVRVLAGQRHPSTAQAENIDRAVEGILKAQEIAQNYGVHLVYENHPGCMAWENPDVSDEPAAMWKILDALEGSSVGINFDTANAAACGLSPVEFLDKEFSRIKTFHITDFTYGKDGERVPTTIGTGMTPNREIIEYAEARAFSGWYCIEEYSSRGLSGMVEAVEFVYRVGSAAQNGRENVV